jgi:uncharacterized membrane protein YciS (DUF1049 family)
MRTKLLTPGGALVAALVAVACGFPEKRVVDQYFNAVNAQDNQTLSSFAAVKFDRKVDRWSIVSVSPDIKAPVTLPELSKKVKEIDKQIADNKKRAAAFAQENVTAWNQVSDILGKNGKVPPKLQGVASEREKFNQSDRELKKALAEAKEALDRERRNVQLSVGDVADVENLSGEMTTKNVDLDLTIGGKTQRYGMGLRKYDLQAGGQAGRRVSRWVVHSLEPKA